MNREKLEELARRVYAEQKVEATRAKRMRTQEPPYYIMNLGHPVIRALYDRWKMSRGLHRGDAPGDVERTCFEMELPGEQARREIEAYLNRVEQIRSGTGNTGGPQ